MTCQTCNGHRVVNFAESTCQPAHQGPCPSCVGTLIATVEVASEAGAGLPAWSSRKLDALIDLGDHLGHEAAALATNATDVATIASEAEPITDEARRCGRIAFALEVSQIDRDVRLTDLTADEIESIIDGILAAAALTHPVPSGASGEVRTPEILRDPNAVHINMLRGEIAKPSVEQIIHVYGRDALAAALATTPGGDLLEQAAREKVEWLFDQAFADGIAAGKSGDDSILAGSSSAYAQAAIRALSPARDGAGS